MADAVVKANHLEFLGKKYFRVGAEDVQLGSYGEKKSPVLAGNYLEVQDRVPGRKLKVKEAVIVEINATKSKKADVLANVSLAGVFGGSSGTAYEDLKNDRLKLVKVRIDNEDMRAAANNSPKALDNLIDYGNDARIAHQVFIVLEASRAKAFTAANTFEVSVNAGVFKITAKGGAGVSADTTVTFSKGSTFAYGLVKLDWDAKLKKNKTKITKLTDDQWGPN